MPRTRRILPVATALLLTALSAGSGAAAAEVQIPAVSTLSTLTGSADAFYTPPSPLPPGEPGDVIRTRDVVTSSVPGARVQQIMYLSTDDEGGRIAVTGLLLTPLNQGLGHDNPLVADAPGTRGLADKCAPSRQADLLEANPASPEYSLAEYEQLLLHGVSVVVTDYEGQGTPGLPSYLVGRPEGYAVLDALRAAQRIDGSGVSERSPVGISGYSQGGQAAGWAAELLGDYAPELRLKGVLAGGVPTDMLTEVNHLNGNPTAGAGFAVAALVGLDHAHPELGLASRLTPEGEQAVERVENACVFEDYLTFGTLTTGDVTQPDVLADPRWQKRFAESRLGTRKPAAPAYVYHGTSDTVVPFSQGSRLYHDWCARGQSVQFQALTGVDHVPGIVLGPPRGVEWLVDRLNGGTAPEGCGEVGLG